MLSGLNKTEFWEIVEEAAREKKEGDIPPPIKDRQKRFKERSDYSQILEAVKEISDKGLPCMDLNCNGTFVERNGKVVCDLCGKNIQSIIE